ncbi:hypothetical protein Tco_0601619 [Tanacetum coccineum]
MTILNIPEEDMPLRRRFVLTAPPPGCDVAGSSVTAATRPPRGQYDSVDNDSKHRMMTSIEEVNLRVSYQAQVRRRESEDFYTQLHDARTDRRDIRLEIDVVRGQRTAYETELRERQSAEDLVVRQMMRTQVLEARAQIDMVEDTGSSCYRIMPITRNGANVTMTPEAIQAMIDQAILRNSTNSQDDGSQNSGVVGLSQWFEKMESVFYISDCAVDNQVKFATCTLLAYTQRFQELALMCTKFLADETAKVDKYIGGLSDNIHGNVMSARPKTLDDAIELANDLMDQKLHTYAKRQNDNKRKANNSSRNNQQPHKKQNVARAYTAGSGEKKAYTGSLPLCTK